jgi:hypothetical protein
VRQLALAAETPLDAASRHHDAGDVLAEVLLQSGPPWRKLDSEPMSIMAIRPNNSRSQNLSIVVPARLAAIQHPAEIGSEPDSAPMASIRRN